MGFVLSRNGEADIYSIGVDGSGLRRLTDDPAKDYAPAWSPDGRRIVFVSDRTSQADIWLMDTDGKNLVQLTVTEPKMSTQPGRLMEPTSSLPATVTAMPTFL